MNDYELRTAIESIIYFNYNPLLQLELIELKIKRLLSIMDYMESPSDKNIWKENIQSLFNLYCHIYFREPISTFNNVIILDDDVATDYTDV